MHIEKNKEVIVGIVTLTAIIILIVGISLGKSLAIGENIKEVKFMFASSGGIKPSAPVVVNGVERGNVTSIENFKDSVLIKATIEGLDDIKEDAHARISILEITGGKKLDIEPGISEKSITEASIIRGTVATDLGELVAIAGSISGDLVNVVKGLDTLISNTNTILADKELIANLKNAINEASSTMTTVNRLVENNENNIKVTFDNMRILTTDLKVAIKEQKPNVEEILANLKQTSNKAVKLLDKVDGSFDKVDKLVTDINKIVEDISTNESFVNRMLYDEEFSTKMDSTVNVLTRFLKKINEHGININTRLGTRP